MDGSFSYLSEFTVALQQLLDPQMALVILIGVVVGLIVGILPGVGAFLTMAIMLPFTFGLSPFHAFGLLLTMYAVASTSSDLTGILFGIPGQSDAAAQIMDGYPMAQRGEAERAMAATTVASAFGGLLGAMVLLIAIPVMRPIVLLVSPAESFMLALLGASVIGAVSGRHVARGIAVAGLGLLMSAIGPNVQTGVGRFTFGSLYLLDGLPLLPIAVGMFAIPELINLHRSRQSIAGSDIPPDHSTAMQGVRDVFRHWKTALRGSVIGLGFGLLPGVGGGVAQWVAYASGKVGSKTPELFGRGAVEGVIAPGAANNSKEGGQLIPTVAFGIPGSPTMALLLGAFLIVGLQPGPAMLQDNVSVTFFLVIILCLANVVAALVLFPLFRHLAKLTFVRAELMFSLILPLVLIGGVAAQGRVGDLVLVVASGLVAYAMRRSGWPVVPWIVGFVLGQMGERQLALTMNIHDGFGWLTRPGVLLLFVAVVAIVLLSVRAQRRARDVGGDEELLDGGVSSVGEIGVGVALVGVAVTAIVLSASLPFGARLFPQVIAALTILTAVVAIVRALLLRRAGEHPGAEAPGTSGAGRADVAAAPVGAGDVGSAPRRTEAPERVERGVVPALTRFLRQQTAVSAIAWIIAMALLVWVVGFAAAIAVAVGLYTLVVARCRLRTAIATAVIAVVIFQVVFVMLLEIALPPTLL